MRRFQILWAAVAASIAFLVGAPAFAADLPIKSPPLLSNTYPSTSGLFFGVYAAGASSKVEATGLPGVNTAGLNEIGGAIGGQIGYVWASADGSRFVRAEIDAGWQNINGSSAGISMGGPATFQAAVQIGAPFAKIAAFLPNLGLPNFPGLPTPPPGVTYGAPHMYAGLMADIEDVSFNYGLTQNTEWMISPGLQIGMLVPTSNGLVIDPRFEYVWNDSGTCFGGTAVCAKQGNTVRFKLGVQF